MLPTKILKFSKKRFKFKISTVTVDILITAELFVDSVHRGNELKNLAGLKEGNTCMIPL